MSNLPFSSLPACSTSASLSQCSVITDSEKKSMMLLTINLSCFYRVMSAFTFPQCLNTRMLYGVRGAPGELSTDGSDTVRDVFLLCL